MKRREWCVNFLGRSLRPEERESVLGDLHERNATVWQTAWELLTLLLYRQLSCWQTWKPWFVLLCVAIPTGILPSQISRNMSGFVVMQLWTRILDGSWFHSALSGRQSLVPVLCICSAIALEAWCSGFVTALFSRATLPISACVLFLIWLFQNLQLPMGSATAWYTLAGNFTLLIVPAVGGMTSGFRSRTVRPRFAINLVFLVSLGMAVSIWADGRFGRALEHWSAGMLPMQPLTMRILPFVLSSLPVFYLLLHWELLNKSPTH